MSGSKKKKILFVSNSCLRKTGFGRNTKEILSFLHKTGKYDIVEFCAGNAWSNDPEHARKPWKSYGTLPDNPSELNAIAPSDPQKRLVAYGSHYLDRVFYLEKPDVVFMVEDIWGVDFAVDKPWWDKVTSVIWTTLDSLPIHEKALAIAPKVKNFWVWSSFAEKAMKKLGHQHVKTVHGAIDSSKFFKLPHGHRMGLRNRHEIPLDAFIGGFVFRNQPRKSVPNLIHGFKMFRNANPEVKNAKLLLHTNFLEGWKIIDFCKEYGVDLNDILTTYVCGQCKNYKVQNYKGDGIACPFCGHQKAFITTGPALGVTEEQLNEVYNLMDCYFGVANSGGLELPCVESKLAELIALITNYSFGEEMCEEGAYSLPLEWSEYREPDSQFIKASTYPSSICKQITKVYKMSQQEREKWGKKAREWALKGFSTDVIGKYIENFIDSSPSIDKNLEIENSPYKEIKDNPNPYALIDNIKDNQEWVLHLYSRILGTSPDKYDSGVRQWVDVLGKTGNRQEVEKYFRQVAAQKKYDKERDAFFKRMEEDTSKKILYVMPESERDLFLSSSLFQSLKEQYPGYKLFVACNIEHRRVLDGNPYIDEIVPYYKEMDNLGFLEGCGNHKGYFDIAFLPYLHTQRSIDYIHNALSNVAFNCKK